jgi:GntR family transcriptional regulator, trigonelline degradation regulator
MTMKSANRSVTGYERIEAICRAICELGDAEKAQRAVYEHIREAAAIAQTILESEKEER